MQFSRRTLFSNAMPTNYRICHDGNCYIKEREIPKTCLINHKGSISHHIMPLVINSLGGGHTHTHIQTSWTEAIPRNLGRRAPGLKSMYLNKMKLKVLTTCKFYYNWDLYFDCCYLIKTSVKLANTIIFSWNKDLKCNRICKLCTYVATSMCICSMFIFILNYHSFKLSSTVMLKIRYIATYYCFSQKKPFNN